MSNQSHGSEDDWDAHWRHYAEATRENPGQRMRHDLIARLLRKDAANGAMRVIDIGSGQGDLLKKLEPLLPNARFLGAELSESGVAISRRKVPQATFLVADILESPSTLDDFAGWATHAVCSEVLEHVDDPVTFLKRASRYLAPEARLIVTVPGGPMSAFDRHIGHRQHFDRRRISGILEQAGYSVERVYQAGFPFFNLYRLLVIARTERLSRDIATTPSGTASAFARLAMRLFHLLFYGNLLDSRFGWQLVAVARKTSP
jgi:SAM-dependent methyltransferase